MNLVRHNEWLWNSRWTHWWLKAIEPGTENESCMESTYSYAIDEDELLRCINAFKRANINTVLTEGLRGIMLFEREGKTDPVIEAIRRAAEACHRAGIRVVHHTTTAFADQRLEKIPATSRKWLNIDAKTGAYAFVKWTSDWEGSGWYLWCINNPDFRAEYFRLCEKIVRETGIDGLMTDEVYFRSGWHSCSCPHCRAKFHIKTGLTLPDGDANFFWGHFNNPAFRAWIRFRAVSVGDFYEDLYAAISKAHSHPVLLGCKNQAECPAVVPWFGDSNEERMRGTNLLFTELSSLDISVLYSWRKLSVCYMAYNGLSNYYGTPTIALLYAARQEEFISWAIRSAHGIRVWITSGGGYLPRRDQLLNAPKDLALCKELFGWEEKHKNELTGSMHPVADIGVLLSASTRDMAHKNELDDWENSYTSELDGWGETLTCEYLQYAVIVEQELILSALQRYALIIIPNAVCLSDAACQAVVEYVTDGGTLIITHKTGTCDETGLQKSISRHLMGKLGICTSASCQDSDSAGQQNVRFGNHGLGKWVFFSHKPGQIVYEDFNNFGKPRSMDVPFIPGVSTEDRELQKSLMLDAIRWAVPGERPLTVMQSPRGLLIKAFYQENNNCRNVVIHLLNLRGESVKLGEIISADSPVEYPQQEEDICFEIRFNLIKEAYLISPDWSGRKPVNIDQTDSGFRLTIPARTLKRYIVLYISTDQPECSTQN